MSEEQVRWSLTRGLGLLWYAQLVLRVLPKLLHDELTKRVATAGGGGGPPLSIAPTGGSVGAVFHNLMLHNWCMGIVSHEVGWTADVLDFLQAECAFDEGELTCFVIYAFGSLSWKIEEPWSGHLLRGGGKWVVHDAKAGVTRRGEQSSAAIAARIRRPSDWAAVSE